MKLFRLGDGSVVNEEEFKRRKDEDFKFHALCDAKRNYGMYRMLRDTALDNVEEVQDESQSQ